MTLIQNLDIAIFTFDLALTNMELTDKELTALQSMLQAYREFTEEIYQGSGWDGTPETLFTSVQRQLFTRFDVVSITYNK